MQETKFKAGTVLQFTEGIYSDYCHAGQVVLLEDVDLEACFWPMIDWYVDHLIEIDQTWPKCPDVAGWLIRKGSAVPLNPVEVHLREYTETSIGLHSIDSAEINELMKRRKAEK